MEREDLRRLERAIRQQWQIPAELYARLPAILGELLCAPGSADRTRIAAARVLAALHADNRAADQGPPSTHVAVHVHHGLSAYSDADLLAFAGGDPAAAGAGGAGSPTLARPTPAGVGADAAADAEAG